MTWIRARRSAPPRAVSLNGSSCGAHDWKQVGVTVRHGASIGARSVCVAPLTIGAWALVPAGSTVLHNVADYALVAGSPARRVGWVGKQGVPLERVDETTWRCPVTATTYREADGTLEENQ